ncbi:MAG: response regulator [Promethearchaeota archaeon]
MNRKKKLDIKLIIIILVIFSFMKNVTADSSTSEVLTIKVGVYENSPLSFRNSEGKMDGVFPSLLDYIALQENWKIEYVYDTFQNHLLSLNSSSIDLLGVIAYNEQRAVTMKFSNESGFDNWGQIFVSASSDIKSIVDLDKKKIGVLREDIHYIGEGGIKNLVKSFNINCTFLIFDSYDEIFKALELKDIDAGVINRLKGLEFQNYNNLKQTSIIFNPIKNVFAAPKTGENSDYILSTIDNYLKELKNKDYSEYYKILDQYIGTIKSPYIFPDWLKLSLISVGIITLLSVAMAIMLRFQVNRRTHELQISQEEFKQSEERLRQSQKMEAIGLLAGGIAHDFNNLLTVINGYTKMILDTNNINEEISEDLQEIFSAGKRASSLTNKLLTFSRKSIIQSMPIDINNIINDLEMMIHHLLSEDITFVTDLTEDRCVVLADNISIEQIILNLTLNARDALHKNGKISIKTQVKILSEKDKIEFPNIPQFGKYVQILIEDNGIGMDEETLTHIFEPFFTTKDIGKGSGLGLSTVYGIVEQLDGFINVVSQIDKGTTFTIYLPYSEKKIEVIEKKSNKILSFNNENEILLIEDNKAVNKFSQKILEKMGFYVKTAINGQEALNIVRNKKNHFDLIISDIIMPEMSGIELQQEILKLYPNAKFLFISGYAENKLENHGIQIQGFNFIRKPFSRENFLQKITSILKDK